LAHDGDAIVSGVDGEAPVAASLDGEVEGRAADLYALRLHVG